jgi:FkbM family methyltransferase
MSRRVNRLVYGRERSWLRYWPRLHDGLRQWLGARNAFVLHLNGLTLCRVLGPYKLCIDPDDHGISPHIAFDGFWEPRVTEVMVDRLRPGMVAIDAGANLGYFTVLMAALTGRRGHVHAFEPVPHTADLLAESIRLNGFSDHVTLHRAALSEEGGRTVSLQFETRYRGGATVDAPEVAGRERLDAVTRRLDEVPSALDAALVKIDTEGQEQAIWRGMGRMIAGSALRWVVVEFSRHAYADAAGFLAEVSAAGFRLLRIDDEQGAVSADAASILAGPDLQMLLFER